MAAGLRVAVDVQHIHRPPGSKHARDRGSLYALANGTTITEASAAMTYAAALSSYLRAHGATVLDNDPAHGVFVGFYSQRNAAATAWKAHAYLACHINSGRGSYAAMEYMSTTIGAELAQAIAPRLREAFPTLILNAKTVSLSTDQRGSDCIERVGPSCAAVLCEPFFGDNPRHQSLLASPELVKVGEAIGQGVVEWWRTRQTAVG